MSIKNSNDIIGNRTQFSPACSEVPQPSALPRKGKSEGKCKSKVKGKSRGKGECKNKGVPMYARVAYTSIRTRFIAPSFLQ